MAELSYEELENLRKKSRTLIACVKSNSKRINEAIKKFRSENLLLKADDKTCINKQYTHPWKKRNCSKAVSGILCPDYILPSPVNRSASVPNMTRPERIVIKSKKHRCNSPLRKPVKECYCYPEVKREQDSIKNYCKPSFPCEYCRSNFEITTTVNRENDENESLATPLSSETLRKIQEIDYVPRSQFLRNILSKTSLLPNGESGDYLHPCSRFNTSKTSLTTKIRQDQGKPRVRASEEKLKNVAELRKAISSQTIHTDTVSGEEKPLRTIKVDKGVQTCPYNFATTIKKTVSSKKPVSKVDEKKKEPANPRCKLFRIPRRALEKNVEDKKPCPEHCSGAGWCLTRGRGGGEIENLSDSEIQRIRAIREQNYFDTHGSNQTLVASDSSGSLEQYMLNERLFPEPVGRIHKEDLVVTMPPCATKQRKRLHYFPKSIVRQEKNLCNTNNTRKRFHGCPLTGHAVDLGIFKTQLPTNSLALKFQKRAPPR